MNKNQRLHKLYAELETMVSGLKDFVQPHGANKPRQWTQQELDNRAQLINQRNKIWEEILEPESTSD